MRILAIAFLATTNCATPAVMSDQAVAAATEAAIEGCPSAEDNVGWQIARQETVLLMPGLLVRQGVVECITAKLEQSGVRYVFEDNRKR